MSFSKPTPVYRLTFSTDLATQLGKRVSLAVTNEGRLFHFTEAQSLLCEQVGRSSSQTDLRLEECEDRVEDKMAKAMPIRDM
jgi:hypothetical protein